MKHLIFIYICINIFTPIFAQRTFNEIIYNLTPPEKYWDIVVKNDTITTMGVGFTKVDSKKVQGIVFTQFDTSGQIIKTKFFIDTLKGSLTISGAYGSLIATKKGNYACILAVYKEETVIFLEMNSALEVIKKIEFTYPQYQTNFEYKMIEVRDGYLLYGALQYPSKVLNTSGLVVGFLKKIDSQGKEVWHKEYKVSPFFNDINDVSIINDSTYTFLLNSELKSFDPDDLVVFNSLYIIDNQGNTLKSWQSNQKDANFYYVDKIVDVVEGNIIVFGHRFIDFYYLKDRNFRPYFAAFDAKTLTLKWQKDTGIKSNADFINNGLWDFTKTIDNNYVGVGNLGRSDYLVSNEGIYTAWLNKFSSKGDEIWSRRIAYPSNLPDTIKKKNFGYFSSVATLSSGSIIAAGKVDIGNDTYGYLVKMTNEGCLDTLFKCDKTIAVKDVEMIDNKEIMKVFPNPAREIVNFEYLITEKIHPGAYELLIRNSLGQVIKKVTMPSEGLFTWNIESLPSGIYHCSLENAGKIIIATRKLIVTK